ncbi:MAG: threonine--tRNA ligase [Candidatus Staskawiczbacteria bacterium]|nr:threonine--tRNA ligase [Candidatus Staskawiczbacteria bacterium]
MSDNIDKLRHSLAHVMAAAVLEMFPKTKLGMGPAVENGFYYDLQLSKPLEEKDLPEIEKKMKELVAQSLKFEKKNINKRVAKKLFAVQPYKLELIKELPGDTVSIYSTGEFVDLCKGPHIKSTKEILPNTFKLTKVAGAYWKGSEKNKMLTRIYGLAFETEKELTDHLAILAEAEKRDHRKLGESLDLFTFSELVGPGLPLYTFKGTTVLNEIKNYSNQLQNAIGYQEVQTPSMNRAELFKVSGHYDKYKDDMFRVCSHYTKEDYYLKPMNCPQHTQIFASKQRSYKDLPIRMADFSQLHRDEKTGELSGLTRLRGFRQDDGHAFCREDQIKDEFKSVLSAVEKAMKTYGMNYKIRLSLWDPKQPEKYLGDAKVWKKSQQLLEEILVENKIEYVKAVGEAAIYGPKMDLISKDSLGREWQISTIQLDFIMPERFKLSYIDETGTQKTPVMIHRALVGSPERFFGILIEHYAGAFPVWMAPIQAVVLPIGEKHIDYARSVRNSLREINIRTEMWKDDTLGKKIRSAEMQKIPYLLIVGDREIEAKTVGVRARGKGDLGAMKTDEFIGKIKEEIANKTN